MHVGIICISQGKEEKRGKKTRLHFQSKEKCWSVQVDDDVTTGGSHVVWMLKNEDTWKCHNLFPRSSSSI